MRGLVCPPSSHSPQPDFVRQMGGSQSATGEWSLDAETQAIITSLLSAGTFFGALLQSLTTDRIGRKGSIMLWAAIVSAAVSQRLCSGLMTVHNRCRRSSLDVRSCTACRGVGDVLRVFAPVSNAQPMYRRSRYRSAVRHSPAVHWRSCPKAPTRHPVGAVPSPDCHRTLRRVPCQPWYTQHQVFLCRVAGPYWPATRLGNVPFGRCFPLARVAEVSPR